MFLLIIYIICYNYYFNNKSWCILYQEIDERYVATVLYIDGVSSVRHQHDTGTCSYILSLIFLIIFIIHMSVSCPVSESEYKVMRFALKSYKFQ